MDPSKEAEKNATALAIWTKWMENMEKYAKRKFYAYGKLVDLATENYGFRVLYDFDVKMDPHDKDTARFIYEEPMDVTVKFQDEEFRFRSEWFYITMSLGRRRDEVTFVTNEGKGISYDLDMIAKVEVRGHKVEGERGGPIRKLTITLG